jgi:hypothetical protein
MKRLDLARKNVQIVPGSLAPATAILLLAGLLRFYNLAGQSLWADEGNSVALARRGFVEIAQRTAFDIHPPFYYWLLKIWVSIFGDSEIGLRSLSAVLGISLVYLVLILGARLFNRRVGLMAALVAAVSPLQVYYSQEARMYMLLALLGVLTLWLTLTILESSPARQKWAGLCYILTVTAGLYTHYAYPLILIVANLFALLSIINYQLPITNHQLPITNYQSPITNYQLPITNYQSPITNHQLAPPATHPAPLLSPLAAHRLATNHHLAHGAAVDLAPGYISPNINHPPLRSLLALQPELSGHT